MNEIDLRPLAATQFPDEGVRVPKAHRAPGGMANVRDGQAGPRPLGFEVANQRAVPAARGSRNSATFRPGIWRRPAIARRTGRAAARSQGEERKRQPGRPGSRQGQGAHTCSEATDGSVPGT